jgi:hypothetical protein
MRVLPDLQGPLEWNLVNSSTYNAVPALNGRGFLPIPVKIFQITSSSVVAVGVSVDDQPTWNYGGYAKMGLPVPKVSR